MKNTYFEILSQMFIFKQNLRDILYIIIEFSESQ